MAVDTLKRGICIALSIVLLGSLTSCGREKSGASPSSEGARGKSGKEAAASEVIEGTITISGAFALYPMVVRWGEEYNKIQPKVQMEVSAGGAGKGMADVLGNMVDLGMVSREIYPAETEKGALGIAVAKDAVIGIVNKANPALSSILKKGVTREKVKALWIDGTPGTWGAFAGAGGDAKLNAYTRSDACGASSVWAEYMGKYKQEDLKGIGIFGDPGIVEAVKADPLGIGYGNVNFVYDAATHKPVEGVVALPLDSDGDGTVSAAESFYETRDQLTKAIAEGAYPSPPARALFLVSNGKPQSPAVVHFLAWVLTEGQNFVEETGYIKLPDDLIQAQLKDLTR